MYKDLAKQRYNTPYLCNLISIHTSRCYSSSIIGIDLGLPRFLYYNIFIAQLNDMQY